MSWTLRVRNANLTGGAVVSDWRGTLVERYNYPDSLQVQGSTRRLRPLFALNGGCTLNDASGRRFSGVLTQLDRRSDGTATCTFDSDLVQAWSRIAYPTPGALLTAQNVDYGDVQNTNREAAILHYINGNLGPGALVARRLAGLTVPASLGRGGTMTNTARLDNLGQLVQTLGEAGALRVTFVQVGTALQVTVTDAPDLTATAKYGTPQAGGPGLLTDWSYTLNAPDLTMAEVAGGGAGTSRTFREVPDAAAQARWGRRIEGLVDQRQTTVVAELDKAGADELLQGSQPISVDATIRGGRGQQLGTDVPVGALVTLNLDGELLQQRLRQLTTTIGRSSDGQPSEFVTGKVGNTDAGLTLTQKEFLAMQRNIRKGQAQ